MKINTKKMRLPCLFLLLLLPAITGFSQTDNLKRTPFTIGESVTFMSTILQQERILNVYLPSSYHQDSIFDYPVIYLLDGSAEEDFIHISGLVQFGSYPWINMIPETIVVGISNIDRKHDFTFPTMNLQDKADFPTTGGSKRFIEFIANEVQALIDSNYRTTGEKTLIGQSLGGLLATEILFKSPEMFNNYIIISPSLWWDDESLLKLELKADSQVQNIFVAVGKEGEQMERTAAELYAKVKLQTKLNSYFEFFKEQNHGDILHLSVYKSFEKMFMSAEK